MAGQTQAYKLKTLCHRFILILLRLLCCHNVFAQWAHAKLLECSSTATATQITPAGLRRPSDARAYTRPLGEHQIPRLPRKSQQRRHKCHTNHSGGDPATPGQPRPAPGRTSDPPKNTKVLQSQRHRRKLVGNSWWVANWWAAIGW